ncbi:PREDICTED: PRAME family member 20-like [Chinchilla lanigera]|uniref:PRAME family member 20-like n=1 Tax=Chinchilla lanigera TaxID=34839 RepID=UPI000697AD2A|nr:PREDICTED: PRAME family member 20-like [Chinchilla lanigera]
MSVQNPSPLYELAKQSLLKSATIASAALHDLPILIFHDLFMDAFMGEHNEVLKMMVQTWPFPYLPLRTLMELRKHKMPRTQSGEITLQQRDLQTLQAILDGIDIQLSQKTPHRRLKLQVLDMRVMHQNFWRTWAENKLQVSSSEAMDRRKTETSVARVAKSQPLKVIVDLCVSHAWLPPVQSYLLKWVQERADRVQLECKKLCIAGLCTEWVTEFLAMLHLDSVREVNVSHCRTFFEFAQFAPFLGQMNNLHKLILSDISGPSITSPEKREQLFTIITSQFLKLHCLREIYMYSVHFLEGHLDQLLSSHHEEAVPQRGLVTRWEVQESEADVKGQMRRTGNKDTNSAVHLFENRSSSAQIFPDFSFLPASCCPQRERAVVFCLGVRRGDCRDSRLRYESKRW